MASENELLLFVKTVFDLVFISFISIFGAEGLIGAIAINLVVVSIFGPILVNYFGLITNETNGFYAVALFGLLLIYERFGYKQAERAVFVCILLLTAFITQSQLDSFLLPNPSFHHVFMFNLRVVGASLVGFAVAARLLLYLYTKLPIDSVYVRAVVAQIGAQFVDTVLFFMIGFFGATNSTLVFQSILLGLAIKVVTIVLTVPFFYFIRQWWAKEDKQV